MFQEQRIKPRRSQEEHVVLHGVICNYLDRQTGQT